MTIDENILSHWFFRYNVLQKTQHQKMSHCSDLTLIMESIFKILILVI